jgi:hypothetical protein
VIDFVFVGGKPNNKGVDANDEHPTVNAEL